MKNLILIALSTLLCFGTTAQTIFLANKNIELTRNLSLEELQQQKMLLKDFEGYSYGIVQFKDIPSVFQIERMHNSGIDLLDYLPDYAYYARFSNGSKILPEFEIRSILKIETPFKLQANLLSKPLPTHAIKGSKIEVRITALSKSLELPLMELIDAHYGKVLAMDSRIRSLLCSIEISKFHELAEEPIIQFIEPIGEPGEPENHRGKASHRVGALTPSYTGLPSHLNGSGMNIMLQDDGVIGPHIDYQGRIGDQFITINRGDHGDHTGGTIMGAGNLNPRYAGMAPAAQLWVYGAAYENYPGFDSIYSHYNKYGIRITSTSYSNGTNAGYTALARKLDDQVEQMNDLTHVFSAGNAGSGFYTITGGHKVAKNVLTIGNFTHLDVVNTRSSRGPARDGRIKPEIGAVGTQVMSTVINNRYEPKTGTSMSCPGVAGTMGVLYQGYKELNNGINPNSALMRGIVCNTADDLGNPGPDFSYGYGRINARKAYDVIKGKTYFKNSVSNGDSSIMTIAVPQNTARLKVMLVWLDPKATSGSSKPLINNLDLEVNSPTSGVELPYVLDHNNPIAVATRGIDAINNLEQVEVITPQPGNYSIKVKGSIVSTVNQEFYVVYYIEKDEIIVEYPVGGESFNPNEEEVVRWSAPDGSGPFDIEFSADSGRTWSKLNSNPINENLYEWRVNSINTSKGKIRVVGNTLNGESPDVFSILRVPNKPTISSACPSEVNFTWNAIQGAKHYVFYRLGAMYMDSIGMSTTNSFSLSKNCVAYETGWFAVAARGINDEIGRRSEAMFFNGNLSNCSNPSDVGLVEFSPGISMVRSCNGSDSIQIQVRVKNDGSRPSSSFTLNLSANASTVVQQNYTLAIASNTSTLVKFNQKVRLNAGNNTIKVWLSNSNQDNNQCNDTLESTSEFSVEEVTRSCLKQDFEDELKCGTESNCEVEVCPLSNGWINSSNGLEDDIDWRVNSGTTPTRNTGPSYDHTQMSPIGKYVYLESSGDCFQKEAHLLSPCINLKHSIRPKLHFWYHLYGNNMGSISVDVLVDGDWKLDVVSPIGGNKGNQWYEQIVDLNSYKGKIIVVRFRGLTGNGFYSDIALDDIQVKDEVNANFSTAASGQNLHFENKSSGANTAKWYFGDGTTSTDYSPNHVYTNPGAYTVKLVIDGPCGKDSITKEIEAVSVRGNYNQAIALKLYPNPAKEELNWNSDVTIDRVKLLDLSGKVIFDEQTDRSSGGITVKGIPAGIYVWEGSIGDLHVRKRIVIQQ